MAKMFALHACVLHSILVFVDSLPSSDSVHKFRSMGIQSRLNGGMPSSGSEEGINQLIKSCSKIQLKSNIPNYS